MERCMYIIAKLTSLFLAVGKLEDVKSSLFSHG